MPTICLSDIDSLPFAYVACAKLLALCVVLYVCIAVTEYSRWRR